MRKLTIEILKRAGACKLGMDEFKRLFPNGTYCTKEDVEKWLKCKYRHPFWTCVMLLSEEVGDNICGYVPKTSDQFIRYAMHAFAREWRRGNIKEGL